MIISSFFYAPVAIKYTLCFTFITAMPARNCYVYAGKLFAVIWYYKNVSNKKFYQADDMQCW